MEILVERFQSGRLHHAYLISGNVDLGILAVASFSASALQVGVSSPDYYEKNYESFGIDDAKEIKEMAYLAPLGERRVFILGIPSITREAQNALLKILEEPPANVHFFIISPTVEMFLPTVRSRVEVILQNTEAGGVDVSAFLSAKIEARLDMVKKIAEEKDKAKAAAFLASVARALQTGQGSADSKKRGLEAVLIAERYVRDPGSSVKQLLEYVALSV